MPMIVITTKSSTRVKANRGLRIMGFCLVSHITPLCVFPDTDIVIELQVANEPFPAVGTAAFGGRLAAERFVDNAGLHKNMYERSTDGWWNDLFFTSTIHHPPLMHPYFRFFQLQARKPKTPIHARSSAEGSGTAAL